MKRLLFSLFAIAIVAACASANHNARWPYRGPMVLVKNPTSSARTVSARDGLGRELVTATMRPVSEQCFRWPFLHTIGYLIATGTDTLTTQPFEPWTSDAWEWSGQIEPVSNPKACRN